MRDPQSPGVAGAWLLAASVFSCVSLQAAPPVDAVVTINEVMYHPTDVGEQTEWIELHNQMTVDVDVSGWRLSGGVDYTFPGDHKTNVTTIIPGGGHLVVARNPAALGVPGALGPWVGSLSNSGEVIRLRDVNDRLMDELEYGDSGNWPVAADGSGASLAKRDGSGASPRADSWVASTEMGGTPGGENFPPPPGPTRSTPVTLESEWKYDASGADLGTAWTAVGYDDSAWTSGEGAVGFGTPGVYTPTPAPAIGGSWDTRKWTGDSDSAISSGKTYTHKIGLGRAGAYSAINGVTFDSPGVGVTAGENWSLTGAAIHFPNNGNGTGANNLPAGSGSRQLCEEFYYGATTATGSSLLTLTGLTPGQTYVTTFYTTAFGDREGRIMLLTPGDTGKAVRIDENTPNTGNGFVVKYTFKAPADGTMTYDFLPASAGATWHHYAFSNEVATTPLPDESAIVGGVTIEDFTSQLVNGTFTRGAANLVNGSGLAAEGVHGITPDGAMWLSNGIFTTPNDPLPATVTFDLGALTDLTSFRVWNYNERAGTTDLTTRGANQVQIQTSVDGTAYTTQGTVNFRRALAVTSEVGERIPLAVNGVRYVRLNMQTSHGGDNGFVGLSEVRFYKGGIPEEGTPVPYRGNIATLRPTGVATDGSLLAPGAVDPHYTLVGAGPAVLAQVNNPAWLGSDGLSQWIGRTASGSDSVPAGTLTYRTSFDLTGYDAATAAISVFFAADNSLDTVKLNGTTLSGVTGAGFGAYLGPFTVSGPFQPGVNTLDFTWTNAGPGDNPGGLRVRFDATAEENLVRTVLPANPVTTYLRKKFTVGGEPGSTYFLSFRHVADDGFVLWLNGQKVHEWNMPAGAVTSSTLAASEVAYPMFSDVIELFGAAMVPGENVLAVELHQASVGNADALFAGELSVTEVPPAATSVAVVLNEVAGASADAGAFFVELANASAGAVNVGGVQLRTSGGQNFTLPAGASVPAGGYLTLNEATIGWRPAAGEKVFLLGAGGATVLDGIGVQATPRGRLADGRWIGQPSATPGAPTATGDVPPLVITEIMYHHAPQYLATGTVDDPEEWVELHNAGSETVSLAGVRLRGGADFDFPPDLTLAPGAYLVVAGDKAALAAKYPAITIVGDWSGGLSNSGDTVRLENAYGAPIDEVTYFDGGRWDKRADGGGSSLELLHPGMDNSLPEAWTASDESAKSAWQTVDYTASGAPPSGSNDPGQYNEFILGLLDAGEVLVDDVSVQEVNQGNRELIQNGAFAGSQTTRWRLLGNHGGHGRSVAVPDPADGANPVLKLVATGPAEHMHNHAETTLRSSTGFVTLNSASTYRIRFRARWVSGSPRLNSRLYFNRAARQTVLPLPVATGTPGAANSRTVALPAPAFASLTCTPAVPPVGVPVLVRTQLSPSVPVNGAPTLRWRLDGGAWNATAMTQAADGLHEAQISGQGVSQVVQFYVEATGANGQTGVFPAGGAASRALVKWSDGAPIPTAAHTFRILMTAADATRLHEATNVMSNDSMPCTVIYRDRDVFFDAAVSLKSSQRGRLGDSRVGFSVDFDPAHLFRGAHGNVNLDRSAITRGTTGTGFGQNEVLNWQFINRAGGVPTMYNDLVYALPPKTAHNGSAALTMAEFNDVYLDSQYADGGTGPTFKYELIYYPTTTSDGTPEGLKVPQPDNVVGVNINSINTPTNKESYRWNFLIGNARGDDDYSSLIAFNQALRLSGTSFVTAFSQAADVDVYLRTAAAMTLCGVVDHYSDGGQHNLKLYARPEDGRILYLPWDHDYLAAPVTTPLVRGADLQKVVGASVAWERAFYGHLHDLMEVSFNAAYLERWRTHYQQFLTGGQNLGEVYDYMVARRAFALQQCATLYPSTVAFAITTNGGNAFTTAQATTTLAGTGPVNVRAIRLAGASEPLAITWTSRSAWQVTVPVAPGQHAYELQALDYRGDVAFTDSVDITGTGSGVPASAANVVISKLHYHPADPTPAEAPWTDADDFEFIELMNISATPVSLQGCRFVAGIEYSFAAGASIPAGGRVIVPRRAAAFAVRHPGVPALAEYASLTGNLLSNSGEEIALVDAGGVDIKRFTFGDSSPWPDAADGGGSALVLMAPMANPDHAVPFNWRASAADDGAPGQSDALPPPVAPLVDADGNGRADFIDYALAPGTQPVIDAASGLIHLDRRTLADAQVELEWSEALETWLPLPPDGADRVGTGATTERLSFLWPDGAGNRIFLRVVVRGPQP